MGVRLLLTTSFFSFEVAQLILQIIILRLQLGEAISLVLRFLELSFEGFNLLLQMAVLPFRFFIPLLQIVLVELELLL